MQVRQIVPTLATPNQTVLLVKALAGIFLT